MGGRRDIQPSDLDEQLAGGLCHKRKSAHMPRDTSDTPPNATRQAQRSVQAAPPHYNLQLGWIGLGAELPLRTTQ